MNRFLETLHDISTEHLLKEKILIMPSFSTGRMAIQSAARKGKSFLNLNLATPYSLALDDVKNITSTSREISAQEGSSAEISGKEIIDRKIARMLVLQLLEGYVEKGSLSYFYKLEMTDGVVNSLFQTIYELRMAGYHADDLQTEDFLVREKGEDIKLLLEDYEKALISLNYLDGADVYKIATKKLESRNNMDINFRENNDVIYLMPEGLKLRSLEKDYLRAKIRNHIYIIPFNSVSGLQERSDNKEFNNIVYHEADNEVSAAEEQELELERLKKYYMNKFTYLYDLENIPDTLDTLLDKIENTELKIFKAYGESNEVRGIFREIKSNEIPFDNVLILTPTVEPYSQLFYNEAVNKGLPVTFGKGIDIKNTLPGRLYFALLEWIKSNYRVDVLIDILMSRLVKLPEEQETGLTSMSRILRSSAIGWGRERYSLVFDKDQNELEIKIKEQQEFKRVGDQQKLNRHTKDQQEIKRNEQRLQSLINTRVFVNDFITHLDIKSSSVLINGLIYIIDKYAPVFSSQDSGAAELINEELTTFNTYYNQEMSLDKLMDRLSELIEGQRVGLSLPEPGSIHLSIFEEGIWIDREYIFLPGLDSSRFPGQVLEDPIILDQERKNYNGLELKSTLNYEKVHQMNRVLANLSGKICLSYPCHNTLEDSELSPSSFLLQVFRLSSGDMEKDYSDLDRYLESVSGFIADDEAELLDEAEYWLYHKMGTPEATEDFLQLFPDIFDGIKASRKKYANEFNEYNGKVSVVAEDVDPRYRDDLIMSSSRLEEFARCPYKYFLDKILKIRLPEEVIYDPTVWLDPMSRGSLLHSIYENFYKELKERQLNDKETNGKEMKYQGLNDQSQSDLMDEIVEEALKKQREILPPPAERIYEREAAEIRETCRLFLKLEEKYQDRVSPEMFELSFGYPGDQYPEPVELTLPDGKKINLSGRIDRIDRIGENSYRILDYKTGRSSSYNNREYFSKGKQLQHALYALAAEKLLNNNENLSSENILNSKNISEIENTNESGGTSESKIISIDESGYYFPTLVGEGSLILRKRRGREKVLEIVEIILNAINEGNFPMTSYDYKNKNCSYCDYSIICERTPNDSLNDIWHNAESIEKLRGLEDYE